MSDIKTITVSEELYNNKDEVARNKISAIENFTNTDFCAALVDFMFPVGSIFISFNDTAPFAYGTWVKVGQGKTLVGVDPNNEDFTAVNSVGNSFGSADSVNVLHTHDLTDHVHNTPPHTHGPGTLGYRGRNHDNDTTNVRGAIFYGYSAFDNHNSGEGALVGNTDETSFYTRGAHSTVLQSGVSGVNQNYQPSLTTYFWQRVADPVQP